MDGPANTSNVHYVAPSFDDAWQMAINHAEAQGYIVQESPGLDALHLVSKKLEKLALVYVGESSYGIQETILERIAPVIENSKVEKTL